MSNDPVPEVGLEPTCPKGQRILNPSREGRADTATDPDTDASCDRGSRVEADSGTRVQENAEPCTPDSDQSASRPSKAVLDFVLRLDLKRRLGQGSTFRQWFWSGDVVDEAVKRGWVELTPNINLMTDLTLLPAGIDAAYYHDRGQVVGEGC